MGRRGGGRECEMGYEVIEGGGEFLRGYSLTVDPPLEGIL